MNMSFLLNGKSVSVAPKTGSETLLDYLRLEADLCGTKEGNHSRTATKMHADPDDTIALICVRSD